MILLPLQHLPLQEAVEEHAVLVISKRSSAQVLVDGPDPTHNISSAMCTWTARDRGEEYRWTGHSRATGAEDLLTWASLEIPPALVCKHLNNVDMLRGLRHTQTFTGTEESHVSITPQANSTASS